MIPYKFIKAFSGKSDSVSPDRYRKETGRMTDIIAVIRREVRLIRQRPVYLTASVGTFTFCIIFFLTFFREGIPHDLPIGIVDNDCSSLSREIRRQLDVTELGKTCIFGNYREAREALQTGSINAFCVIPENFSEDVQAGRQPVFTFYVNSLYFVGGSLAYKDVLTMANLASGAVQREILTAKGMDKTEMAGMLQPIVIDAHQIGNTTTDYGVYLTNVLLPARHSILDRGGTQIRYLPPPARKGREFHYNSPHGEARPIYNPVSHIRTDLQYHTLPMGGLPS